MAENFRILIVDDDRNTCTALTDLLTEHGYKAVVAHDGKEALEKVQKENPDLVLMDILLPDTNGYEVCEEIKNRRELTTKVILYTGFIDAVDAAKAREAGADDFVGKTSDLVNLYEAIKKLV